ncbi:HAD family hydrolase [uncultured Varibaculum sp.]|uniref:HAD family hydrolase n=1 Tax=uncultured Varibaculum sp. TaxID=413896 RepID=UPI002676EAFB|nr:HAD family hydrolase [uncultured Varibaculum sp.]
MRKFAFLDLDGTIIDHNQVISSKVKEAITTATANGHKVFIATGRSYPELYPFLFSLPFSGLITANGAYVEVGEQVLSSHSIDQDGICEWMDYFRRSGASWLWQCRDHFYPSETFLDFFRLFGKSERAASGDWSAYLEQIMPYVTNGTPSSAEKCVFYLSPEASSSVEEAHSLFGDRYMVIPGSVRVRAGEMVEVGVKGVNKGSAMREVLHHFGADPSQALAIGDSANDFEMLQEAGIGITLEGGANKLLEMADWVAPSIAEDGVTVAFERFGLLNPS